MSDEALTRPRSGFARGLEPSETKWPSDRAERGRAMAAAGIIGGARFGALGGKPMHKEYQAQQAAHLRVARAAAEHAEENVRMIMRIIRSGQSTPRDKLDAYDRLMQAEQFVAKNTLAHEKELRKMSDEDLTLYLQRRVLETLGYDPDAHDLSALLEDNDGEVIEGIAVEDAA